MVKQFNLVSNWDSAAWSLVSISFLRLPVVVFENMIPFVGCSLLLWQVGENNKFCKTIDKG